MSLSKFYRSSRGGRGQGLQHLGQHPEWSSLPCSPSGLAAAALSCPSAPGSGFGASEACYLPLGGLPASEEKLERSEEGELSQRKLHISPSED